jgi:hypothetical protein
MAGEKTDKVETKAPTARLTYIQFRDPVPLGISEFSNIEYWSEAKHGKRVQAHDKGNWIVLSWDGGRARVPMTNVSCIKESDV